MKRRMFAASFTLAVLSVLWLAGPASAGEQVPFKGGLEGFVTRTPPPPAPPPIFVEVAATGTATQLGLFTLEIPHVVIPPNADGFYHFVTANGDTLCAEFTGLSAPAIPGVLRIVETATITGGTGRFAGASGGFIVERLYFIAAGTTIGSFEGTISSPGAGNP